MPMAFHSARLLATRTAAGGPYELSVIAQNLVALQGSEFARGLAC
ncbi:hypothetical protein SAMN05445871_0452 [Paraburkholderia caballeronis]|uniref:Uncharacterized protein n=1 Tax=Paraburkholderia caballeronis TaxID=416943 RepID=A0A1H7SH31_9BURK|nr:hypothetical protein C7403_11521 [Paraburkholderia caballeronis]PXW95956.1 hypothetical protein C7407_11521 [Paraburkholderia caballeronis]RAJ92322.1 hypothetical protein C7409_11521 [Paraburkholderia caballeronis]TDV27875.1 hypothetical protein C7405_11521 [Paraburkholderia caballeronis]SEB52689.1 hypothetical protein SAMN05445871_0452 [Paraburkholderia caballeronis]